MRVSRVQEDGGRLNWVDYRVCRRTEASACRRGAAPSRGRQKAGSYCSHPDVARDQKGGQCVIAGGRRWHAKQHSGRGARVY